MKVIIKPKIRTQVITATMLGTLALMLGSPVADAVTVYFNDADRGPADTLQIDGVTVTGGQLATVAGLGLGKDNGIGTDGEFDEQMHFSSGQVGPDTDTKPGLLQLNVDGVINSITIVPNFSILSGSGTLMPDTLPFGIVSYWGGTPSGFPQVNIAQSSIGQPVILYPTSYPPSANTYVQFQIASDFGEFNDWFLNYREQNESEEQTFQFGITLLSLDYTPDPGSTTISFVPEPSSITFLVIGLIVLLFARQGRWFCRNQRVVVAKDY
jgi:hypothetical protein